MKHLKTFESLLNDSQINEAAIDKIHRDDLPIIAEVLNDICARFIGSYWKTLNDPQQTHTIHGAGSNNIDRVKKLLSEVGAKNFKIIKNANIPVITFDATEIKL